MGFPKYQGLYFLFLRIRILIRMENLARRH